MGPGFTKIKVRDCGEFVLTYSDLIPRNNVQGAVEGGSTVFTMGRILFELDDNAVHSSLLDFLAVENGVVTLFGSDHPLLGCVFAASLLPVGTWVQFRKVIDPLKGSLHGKLISLDGLRLTDD